jgi:lauroyl/myristoyl acyltransferase
MPDFILDRWSEDVCKLRSTRGNVDIPTMISGWLDDAEWTTMVRSLPQHERRYRLGVIGRRTFDCDTGRFATELRWNTRTLNYLWPFKKLDQILRRHVELLFASVSDAIDFLDPGDAQKVSRQAKVSGFNHLEEALRSGRGVILLGAYQCHPGFLLYHPFLTDRRIAAIQHSETDTLGQAPAGPPGARRVCLLPDSRASVRTILELLNSGQCIVFYNDFIYPTVAPIKSPLFGQMVLISRALISIALKTGASVLPFAIARQWPLEKPQVHLDFFPRLPLASLDDTNAKHLVTAACVLGLATECLIRRYPAQWRLWNTLNYRWQQAKELS